MNSHLEVLHRLKNHLQNREKVSGISTPNHRGLVNPEPCTSSKKSMCFLL